LRGGKLAPCPTGQPIVPLGTTTPAIREAIADLGRDVTARRGCAECEVRDHCARCLLTGPIREETYCRIQKARAGVGWFNFRVINDLLLLVGCFDALVAHDPEATVEFAARADCGVVPGPGLAAGAIATLVDVPNIATLAHRIGLARSGPGADWHLVTTRSASVVSDELALGIGLVLDGWTAPQVLARIAEADPDVDAQELLDASCAALSAILDA
jgi:hypothetical protein